MARQQGGCRAHVILGLEFRRKVTYGRRFEGLRKDEPAMMVSRWESQGYKVWTVGADIA